MQLVRTYYNINKNFFFHTFVYNLKSNFSKLKINFEKVIYATYEKISLNYYTMDEFDKKESF